MTEQPTSETIAQMHHWFAVECNNSCWNLMYKADRTPEDDRDLLYRAYAAAYHWSYAGTPLNGARAELTLANVHSQLDHSDLALHYAQLSLDYFENNDCEDWDLAFGHAAMAYAAATSGDADLHAKHYIEAKRRGEAIANEIDRTIFMESFNQVPTEVIRRSL